MKRAAVIISVFAFALALSCGLISCARNAGSFSQSSQAAMGSSGSSSGNASSAHSTASASDALSSGTVSVQSSDRSNHGTGLHSEDGSEDISWDEDPYAVHEIVCWGDSLTSGIGADEAVITKDDEELDVSFMSYPEILEELTGIATYNFGVSGATSHEIAAMQGALKFDYPRDQITNLNLDVVQESREHPGDVMIIAMGSNGGWNGDYGELILQYKAMLEFADCDRYIIVGDTDDPGTSFGDPSQRAIPRGMGPGETRWEMALEGAFGDHFINMRVFLIEHGLETAGLEVTPEDAEAALTGRVPGQLRADWTHLNSYGYYAQAIAIYEKGQELGYWE